MIVVLIFNLFLVPTAGAQSPEQTPAPTFDSALTEMVEQNVDVKVQRTKLSASETKVNAARFTFGPQLNLQAQQQNSNSNAVLGTGVSVYSAAQVYSANASWNLFRSGADVAGLKAALIDRDYQTSLLDDNYLQAEDKAARALLDLIMKKQVLEAYRRSEESSRHFLEIAKARFDKSLLSREETDRVALDASNSEARRSDSEALLNEAIATVEGLLGHPAVIAEWPWTARFGETRITTMLNEKSQTAALTARPDYRAARALMDNADQLGRSLYRSMLPTVDVAYSVGETHVPGVPVFSSWSTLATLTIPIWNGLHDYSTYRTQVEAKYASEYRMQQLEKDVGGTMNAAQANYRLALQQYGVRTANLTLAKHILQQEEARFRMGRADANELNLDLARVTNAEVLAIQGIAQVHLAYLQLVHVFGQRVQ